MYVILNSIFPVCAVIALGCALRRYNLASGDFFKISDKLIYFIFFPVMLFYETGKPSSSGVLDWRLGPACIAGVIAVALAGLLYTRLTRAPDFAVGSFSQCCYRFNTYVGMAVVLSVFAEEGVRRFGAILVFTIPFINLIAVSTLIWHSGKTFSRGEKLRRIGGELVSNPLIIACLAGFLYSMTGLGFTAFLANSFKLLSSLSLPMALLSIGYSLDWSRLRGYFRFAVVSSVLKLLVLPVAGYFSLKAFGVDGLSFKVAMTYFALPTSSSIYILSSQLDSDLDLASAGIVLSTVLSLGSLSAILVIFGN